MTESTHSGKIEFGSTVEVETQGKKMQFMMVSKHESNPSERKISTESPLGLSLMGKKAGETAIFETAAGKMEYQILKVE